MLVSAKCGDVLPGLIVRKGHERVLGRQKRLLWIRQDECHPAFAVDLHPSVTDPLQAVISRLKLLLRKDVQLKGDLDVVHIAKGLHLAAEGFGLRLGHSGVRNELLNVALDRPVGLTGKLHRVGVLYARSDSLIVGVDSPAHAGLVDLGSTLDRHNLALRHVIIVPRDPPGLTGHNLAMSFDHLGSRALRLLRPVPRLNHDVSVGLIVTREHFERFAHAADSGICRLS